MEFGARHSHWYWQKASFQKGHGHTNIPELVGRAIFRNGMGERCLEAALMSARRGKET